MHLEPAMLEATYELLRTTLPFRRWSLPHADEVEFHVTKNLDVDGDCDGWSDIPIIRISAAKHGVLSSLVLTMAHEMTHLRQFIVQPNSPLHGAYFKYLAAQVCRHHGFDLKAF